MNKTRHTPAPRRCARWLASLSLLGLALAPNLPALGQDPPPEEAPELIRPKLKTVVQATYPPRALEEGIEAVVILQIDIDTEGNVEAVAVIQPAEPAGYGFDEAAVEAAMRFEFDPAMEGDVAIPVRVNYPCRFKLPDPGAKEDPEPKASAKAPGIINYRGLILERGTRDPLVGAVITVFKQVEGEEPVGYEALTDSEGGFIFRDMEAGVWKVLVDPEGYFPVRTTETLSPDYLTQVVYYAEKGSYNPFDVIVEGVRFKKEVSRRVLSAQEIDRIPGTFGDPLKVVRNLPGVARTEAFLGEIIVRGSSSEDTRLFVDSVGAPILFHFGGLRSVIPLGMVDNIEFYPGNFSVYYGRAIGGVLDVDLKDLRGDRWHGYADINLFDAGLYLEIPVTEGLSIAGAVRRSYIDTVIEAIAEATVGTDEGFRLVAAPAYYDWQVMVDWRPHRDHKLKAFVFGSSDEFRLILGDPATLEATNGDLSLTISALRGIVEHTWTIGDDLTSEARLSTGNDEVSFEVFGVFTFETDLYQPSFRETLTWTLSDRTLVRTGLDVVWSNIDLSIDAPPGEQEGDVPEGEGKQENSFFEERDVRVRDVGAFMELELKLSEGLLFVPGARVDYLEAVDALTFDPRISARWDIAPEWTLKGAAGLFHQPPPGDQTAGGGFGNPELGAEAAYHYALGVEWSPLEYLLVDTTAFYKDMFDLVSRSERFIEVDGEEVPEIFNNRGVGRVVGLELLIRHEFANNFFGWVAYTLSRSERRDDGASGFRLFDFDQTHILTVVGAYRLPKNWEVSSRLRYVTGNPTTPIVGGVFNVDSGEYEPVSGRVNSERVPAYFQVDLRLDKRWIYDKWNLNLYFDIQNITNRSNPEGFVYNFDFSQRGVATGLPLLSILGIKAEF